MAANGDMELSSLPYYDSCTLLCQQLTVRNRRIILD